MSEETVLADNNLSQLLGKLRELNDIAWAAHALEKYLGSNTGQTDDWPIHITADDSESARKLSEVLTDLQTALKPFRDEFMI